MAKQSQEKKKSDKKAVKKDKISSYWLVAHPRNMTKRAKRVYRRVFAFSLRRLNQLDMTQQYALYIEAKQQAHELARTEAQKCASTHGPVVEAALQRWLAS